MVRERRENHELYNATRSMRKQILLVAGFLVVVVIVLARVSWSRTKGKSTHGVEWPTFRGNNNRDGRVIATGKFTNEARLSESVDYSTSVAYIGLSPASSTSSVHYDKGTMNEAAQLDAVTTDWQTGTEAYLDLSGDGKITRVSPYQNVKYARLFKNDNKYYRIEAHDGFGFVNTDTMYVGIRVYEGNSDRLVFDKKFKKKVYMQRPHITVADMNNDGEKDIIITSWEGIYVFNNKGDSIAGLSQETKGWHHLRKRGFACVADIDGNGYKDVIIIGSYPYHVDVIKNDHGKLKFGWTKIFDGHIESAKKISRPILNSVSDFDGDGTYEILINVYNYNDDSNWAGVLFDPVDGKVKAQIKNAFVQSASDLNNDGHYVFFCTETQGHSIPTAAPLKVVSFTNGTLQELLHIDKGEWINPRVANVSPTVTTHADGVSNLAENGVLCADYEGIGQKAFFTKVATADGGTIINGYYIPKGQKAKKTALSVTIPSGMYGEILRERKNTDGKHSLLLQVKAFATPAGTVQVEGAEAKDLGRFKSPGKKTHIPVVADIDSDGSEEILIANDVGEVLCFGRDHAGAMSLRWMVPGYGMRFQYTLSIDYGVSVDDLDHDGDKEVIVSGEDEAGAALFVYDHGGKLLWKKSFPEINGGDITTYDGNIAFFGTVQSSQRKNRDVVVTVQRVVQHTGKTYCLSGSDGAILWKLDTLTAPRDTAGHGDPVMSGAGGNVFSTHDIDGDGSDEVMCGYGNIVFFADSNDGTIKFKSFMRKLFLDKYDYVSKGYSTFWIDQVLPVAFTNDGTTELACFNSLAEGTMDTKGALVWSQQSLGYTGRLWQCMANLDGDGKLWVVELSTSSAENKQVLFAYDPVNGALHETFSMELEGGMPVACDLNGDGRDEIVVSNATGICCIGYSSERMSVLWKYPVSGCGPAVVADTDADGYVEVVAATQDGKIVVIDQ